MSGRGRGRGRGGRGGVTSQARLLLQKSAAEAGVDERLAIDLTRPALYPDMLWHSSGRKLTLEEETTFKTAVAADDKKEKKVTPLQFTKRTTAMTFLVRKQRLLLEQFQSSPSFVRYVPPHMDVTRFHEIEQIPQNTDRPDERVRQALGKHLANPLHLPEELLEPFLSASKRKKRKRRLNADGTVIDLDEFEAKERRGGTEEANSDDDSSEEDDTGLLPLDTEEDEDEDDNADYTKDYYESEDESDGGGDSGEPTF